jgi:hypothetical protein
VGAAGVDFIALGACQSLVVGEINRKEREKQVSTTALRPLGRRLHAKQ